MKTLAQQVRELGDNVTEFVDSNGHEWTVWTSEEFKGIGLRCGPFWFTPGMMNVVHVPGLRAKTIKKRQYVWVLIRPGGVIEVYPTRVMAIGACMNKAIKLEKIELKWEEPA